MPKTISKYKIGQTINTKNGHSTVIVSEIVGQISGEVYYKCDNNNVYSVDDIKE